MRNRVTGVVIALILAILAFSRGTQARVTTGYFIGFGSSSYSTSDNAGSTGATYRQAIDYVVLRYEWCSLQPSNSTSYSWSDLDNRINNVLNDGKFIILGIQLKKVSAYIIGARNTGSCTDGTPNWLLTPGSIYDPVPSATSGLYMLNYSDSDVSGTNGAIQNMVQALVTHVYANWPSGKVIFSALPGADGEFQAETGTEETQYQTYWGGQAAAQTKWVTYNEWLIDTWNTELTQHATTSWPRIFCPTSNPFGGGGRDARNTVLNYLVTVDPSKYWGLYFMNLNPGANRAMYEEYHYWNELQTSPSLMYKDAIDVARILCRNRACYAEASIGGIDMHSEWMNRWLGIAALSQKIDSYNPLKLNNWNSVTGVIEPWVSSIVAWWDGVAGNPGVGGRIADTSAEATLYFSGDYVQDTSIPNTLKTKNWGQWLDQINTSAPTGIGTSCDGNTTAVYNIDSTLGYSANYWNAMSSYTRNTVNDWRSAFSRSLNKNGTGQCAYIDIDPYNEGWMPTSGDIYLTLTYLDYGTDSLSVECWNATSSANILLMNIVKTGTGTWKTETSTAIPVSTCSFNTIHLPFDGTNLQNYYHYDLRINSNNDSSTSGSRVANNPDGYEFLHSLIIKKGSAPVATWTPTPTSTGGVAPTATKTPTVTPTWTPGGPTATPTPTFTPMPTSSWGEQVYTVPDDNNDAYDRATWCTVGEPVMGRRFNENLTTGLRFIGISKPNSTAKLLTAILRVTSANSNSTGINLRIYAQDTETTVQFDAIINATATPQACIPSNRASDRTKTTAYVEWNPESWGANTVYESPNIASVLQEVLDDNAGWDNNESFVIIVTNTTVTDTERTIAGVNNINHYAPAKLILTWYDSSPPTPAYTATPTALPPTPTAVATAIPTVTSFTLSYATGNPQSSQELLKFAPPACYIANPATCTLVSATLGLNVSAISGGPVVLRISAIAKPWVGAYATWWAWYEHVSPPEPWTLWTTPGIGSNDITSTGSTTLSISSTGWKTVTITTLVANWQVANYGLLLKIDTPTNGQSVAIDSMYGTNKPSVTWATR